MKKIGVVGIPGSWSTEELVNAVEKKTGSRFLIDMSKVYYDLGKGEVIHEGIDLTSLDGLIIKKIGSNYSPDLLDRLEILRFLSGKGIKVFSNPNEIIRVLDRLSCTVTLNLGDIPIPPTVITEDLDRALKTVEAFEQAVFKPLYTSKARGMMVIEAGKSSAKDEIIEFKLSGNPMMYIQKIVPIPGKDLGIVFLGGDYLATYARVRKNDSWNTTTHSGGQYEAYTPSQDVIDLAHKAQSLFNLDFTCVDLVEAPNGPLIFEVSAFGGFRGLQVAHEIDAAKHYAQYVLEELKHD